MIKKILLSAFIGSGLMASVALAAEPTVNGCLSGNFQQLVSCVTSTILNPLVALLIGVALLVLMWGIVKYIASGADATKRKEGAALVFYGVIGLFVMVSVWGLVKFLTNTFFGADGPATTPPVPTINLGSGGGPIDCDEEALPGTPNACS